MSRVTKGELAEVVLQPDRSINEKNDGTLEGQVVYKCDRANVSRLPRIGDAHPDDSRLEAYNISKTYNSSGLVTSTISYFGLIASTTTLLSHTAEARTKSQSRHIQISQNLQAQLMRP